MTSRRILLSSAGVLIGCVLLFIASCRDEVICPDGCVGCLFLHETSDYCQCEPDTVNYKCPAEMVHASFDFYNSCTCQCDKGWTGALCDQRDTTYYARFWFGTDTNAFSGYIRTSAYELTFEKWKFYDFAGSFPAGFEIDSLILTQLPSLFDADTLLFPLCQTSSCTRMEVFFSSGATATAVSGFATIDSSHQAFGTGSIFGLVLYGQITANLEEPVSGETLYIREGTYKLPY